MKSIHIIRMSYGQFVRFVERIGRTQPAVLIRHCESNVRGIAIRQDSAKFARLIDNIVIFWEDGDIGCLTNEEVIEVLNINLWEEWGKIDEKNRKT